MELDHNPYRILVIEDNVGDRVLIDDYLRGRIRSPEILWAGSFEEAKIQIISRDRFDVMLLDLTLPDCAGQVLIENTLALAQNIPVIVLTGYGNLSFAARSMGLGISDYLLKEDLDEAVLYKSIRYSIERKKYISALQDSEKRYSDLFQISPQPAWCIDTQTQCFLEVNDAAVSHYGYSREAFLAMRLKDLYADRSTAQEPEALCSEEQIDTAFDGVHCHYKKDGQAIAVELKNRLIYRQGEWVCLMLVNDVTVQREYIKSIEHQNQMLQDIVWMQSHEVRAPLARIMGLVQLLHISDDMSNVSNAELLIAIQHSSEELDQMIHAMVKKTEDVQAHMHQSPLLSASNPLTL